MRKIIQIVTDTDDNLYALCGDGTIWRRNYKERSDSYKWTYIPTAEVMVDSGDDNTIAYHEAAAAAKDFEPKVPESKFRKMFEAGMDIGVGHSKEVVEKAKKSMNDISKEMLANAEWVISQYQKGQKVSAVAEGKDEIKGEPI